MIFSRKLLQYMEFTSADEEQVVIKREDTSQLMEEEPLNLWGTEEQYEINKYT